MQRIIHTDRLVLRPAYIGDAGRIVQIMEYDISKWLNRVSDPYTLTDAQDWLSSLRFERDRYVWAITRDGVVIGMIGIDPTLGYWIAKEYWGQSYVPEATHAVLSAYFHDPFADPIYSGYFVENERSAQILSKLGFSPMDRPVATVSAARNAEVPLQRMVLTPEQWAALNPLTFDGERVHVRPFQASDVDVLWDINGRENVSKNFATWPYPLPRNYVERRVADMRWKNGWNCGFAIDIPDMGVIGSIGFASPSQGVKQDMEIGYGLHPAHWGRGYVTEAANLICEYLFQRYPIEKNTAYANLDNIGSQRVLQKTGFRNVAEEDQKSPARGTVDRVYRFERYRT
jgi:RimJ/RimL family protein N-acetyltransferase